jgi:hypothetical protein
VSRVVIGMHRNGFICQQGLHIFQILGSRKSYSKTR